jgi:phosphate transport system substrate-binding protein
MHSMPTRRNALVILSSMGLSGIAGAIPCVAADDILRSGGTGSATEMLRALSGAFKRVNSSSDINVNPGLGSTGGIHAVRDGAIDFAVAARSLKPDEAAVVDSFPFARSPFVVATSHPNPNSIRISDIARMISDPQAKWQDGSPVRVVLRPRNESDTALIASLFPGVGEALEAARKRNDVPVAVNDQENATMAETMPGSFAGMSLMQLELEKRRLRVVPIDGKSASLAALESGAYPFARDIHLVVAKAPSPSVARFVSFLRSPEGRSAIRGCGCQPLS